MTQPNLQRYPGDGFVNNPLFFVIPGLSVAPSYLGVFGHSKVRTLTNCAGKGLAPCTAAGADVTLSEGYASFSTFPEAGLQSSQLETPNYTWMGLIRVPGITTDNASVFGEASAAGALNNTKIYATSVSLTITQVNSDASAVNAALGVGSSPIQNWGLYCFTGTSGVGMTSQTLTVGQANTVFNIPNAKIFSQTTRPFKIGTGTSGTSTFFRNGTDCVSQAYFPSVLSSGDQAALAAWMRKLAARSGITV